MIKKSELQQYIKWGAIAAAVYVGFKLLKPFGAAGNTLGNVLATKAENTAIKSTTGLTDAEIELCRDVANRTNTAMYTRGFWQMSWFGGSTEDEGEVVRQLNRLTTGSQASLVSNYYQSATEVSLAADVNKYLDADERNKIKPIILSNLL